MNNAVMFGKATDEWTTPLEFFSALNAEFGFDWDVAANDENALCDHYFGGSAVDALTHRWHEFVVGPCWMNPPYSRCREFIAKAAEEARHGVTTVALVPSRTDTRWWHDHVWDRERDQPRPGVEIRFIKGRLKFGNSENSAPFPSVV